MTDMKARLKFSKIGSMRFIGHLDVMRYFQKAFRRAEIGVSYSKGFSPHQLMSFASPLGIGLSSDAEYLDVTLEKSDSQEEMIERINAVMNDEITVKDFTILDDEAKPSMAMLSACDYVICIKPDKDNPLTDDAFAKEDPVFAIRQIEGVTAEEDGANLDISYVVPVTDSQNLEVEILADPVKGTQKVVKWKESASEKWEEKSTLPVLGSD